MNGTVKNFHDVSTDLLHRGYVEYVKNELNKNKKFISEEGSLKEFLINPTNFIKYLKNIKGKSRLEKKIHSAFNCTSIANNTSIIQIYEAFKPGINYVTFSLEVRKGTLKYLRIIRNLPPIHSITKVGALKFKIFEVVPSTCKRSRKADLFYDGYKPKWSDLEANYDFQRNLYCNIGGIRDTIFKIITSLNSLKYVSIKGVAGSGKSTLIARAAYDLAKQFPNIYYLNCDLLRINELYDVQAEIISALEITTDPIVFAIDGYSQFISKGVINFRNIERQYMEKAILFILADNNIDEYDSSRTSNSPSSHLVNLFELQPLDDFEIESIVTTIERLEHNGELSRTNRQKHIAEYIEICKDAFGRELLVAMMQLRHGKRFPDIIKDECNRLEEKIELFTMYKWICLFEYIKVPMFDFIILHAMESNSQSYLSMHTLLHLFTDGSNQPTETLGLMKTKNEMIVSRHPLIAAVVFQLHFQNKFEIIRNTFRKLLRFDYLKDYNEDEGISKCLLNIFMPSNSPEYLHDVIGKDNAIIFYDSFRNCLLYDANFRYRYLYSEAKFYLNNNEIEKAVKSLMQIYIKLKKSKFYLRKRMIAYKIGSIYFDSSDYIKALPFITEALELSENDDQKLEPLQLLVRIDYEKWISIFNNLKLTNEKSIKRKHNFLRRLKK